MPRFALPDRSSSRRGTEGRRGSGSRSRLRNKETEDEILDEPVSKASAGQEAVEAGGAVSSSETSGGDTVPKLLETFAGSLARFGERLLCPVCRSLYKNAAKLPCNHAFCRDCIMQSLSYNQKCPECRAPSTRRNVTDFECMQRIVRCFQTLHPNSKHANQGSNGSGAAAAGWSPSDLTQPETASQLMVTFKEGMAEYLDEAAPDGPQTRLPRQSVVLQSSPLYCSQEEEAPLPGLEDHAAKTSECDDGMDHAEADIAPALQLSANAPSPSISQSVMPQTLPPPAGSKDVPAFSPFEDEPSAVGPSGPSDCAPPPSGNLENGKDAVGEIKEQVEMVDDAPASQNEAPEKSSKREQYDGILTVGSFVDLAADWSPGHTLDGGLGIVMDITPTKIDGVDEELITVRLVISKTTQKVTRSRIMGLNMDMLTENKRPRRSRTPTKYFSETVLSTHSSNYTRSSNSKQRSKKVSSNNMPGPSALPKSTEESIRPSSLKKSKKKSRRKTVKFSLPADDNDENAPSSSSKKRERVRAHKTSKRRKTESNIKRKENESEPAEDLEKKETEFPNAPTTTGQKAVRAPKKRAAKKKVGKASKPIKFTNNPNAVLLCLGFKKPDLDMYKSLAQELGGRVNTSVRQCDAHRPTHVIVKTASSCKLGTDMLLAASRTMSYMIGVMQGAWIVSGGWAERCKTAKSWVDPGPFEVQGAANIKSLKPGGPERARLAKAALELITTQHTEYSGLFDGLTFFMCGNLKPPIKSHELESMIRLADGRVFDINRILEKAEDKEKCFLLVAPGARVPEFIVEMVSGNKITIVHVDWALDSISNYNLMDFAEYCFEQGDESKTKYSGRSARSGGRFTRRRSSRRGDFR